MPSPIIVSSSSTERIPLNGEYDVSLKKVEAKEGTDKEGNKLTRIRFHLVTRTDKGDAYCMVSAPARLPGSVEGKPTRLYQLMKQLAPKEYRGDMRFDGEKTWTLAQALVGRKYRVEIKHEDGWNNLIDVIEAYEPDAMADDDDEVVL